MTVDLTTTNVLLGILAGVSLLEAVAVLALFGAGALLYHRLRQVIDAIEERQVAPAMTRVNAILDDVKGVTGHVKQDADRLERILAAAVDAIRRWRSAA